jgi:hypothetical protein
MLFLFLNFLTLVLLTATSFSHDHEEPKESKKSLQFLLYNPEIDHDEPLENESSLSSQTEQNRALASPSSLSNTSLQGYEGAPTSSSLSLSNTTATAQTFPICQQSSWVHYTQSQLQSQSVQKINKQEYGKEYYQKNKNKCKEYDKEYREKNKNKRKEYSKKYCEKNKDGINKKRRMKRKLKNKGTSHANLIPSNKLSVTDSDSFKNPPEFLGEIPVSYAFSPCEASSSQVNRSAFSSTSSAPHDAHNFPSTNFSFSPNNTLSQQSNNSLMNVFFDFPRQSPLESPVFSNEVGSASSSTDIYHPINDLLTPSLNSPLQQNIFDSNFLFTNNDNDFSQNSSDVYQNTNDVLPNQAPESPIMEINKSDETDLFFNDWFKNFSGADINDIKFNN